MNYNRLAKFTEFGPIAVFVTFLIGLAILSLSGVRMKQQVPLAAIVAVYIMVAAAVALPISVIVRDLLIRGKKRRKLD